MDYVGDSCKGYNIRVLTKKTKHPIPMAKFSHISQHMRPAYNAGFEDIICRQQQTEMAEPHMKKNLFY